MANRFNSETAKKARAAVKNSNGPNKDTLIVRDAFKHVFIDLQNEEKTSLKGWAKNNLTDFYKLFSKLIPVEITGEDGKDIAIQVNVNRTLLGTKS